MVVVESSPSEPFPSSRELAEPRARVVVSVGTDHHPFDRLMGWIERWSSRHPDVAVVVQRGTSAPPAHLESHDLIGHAELCELFASADVVVSHGGPSTVMDARMAGRLPIVVPRDPQLGEHVDGHQLRFADHLDRHGLARLAATEAEFARALDQAVTGPTMFRIERDVAEAPPGVIRFAAVVDDVLGVRTDLHLAGEGTDPS